MTDNNSKFGMDAKALRYAILGLAGLALFACAVPYSVNAQRYDTVILNGRVIDPESGLDAIRNIGITNSKIAIITARKLRGKTAIDARHLVVSPGFIDLNTYGMPQDNDR